MADILTAPHAGARPAPLRRLRDGVAALAAAFAQAREYRRTHDALSRLSDRELADLGMTRATLRSVAYHAVYGA